MMNNSTHFPFAFCGNCGTFEARAFAMQNSSVTFTNCTTNCPRCGRSSEIIPGRYETVGHKLNLLIDKSISKEALKEIASIARKLQAGDISDKDAQKEIEQIAPSLAGFFNFSDWSNEAKPTLLAGIVAAAGAIVPHFTSPRSGEGSVTINNHYYNQENEANNAPNDHSSYSGHHISRERINSPESYRFTGHYYFPISQDYSIRYRFHLDKQIDDGS